MCEIFHCHWGKLELTGFRAGRNHANHTVCFDMKWRVGKIGDSPLSVSSPWNWQHWKFPLACRKWSCSFYLIRLGVLFVRESFNEGLELIFASAMVSSNKSWISWIGNVLSFLSNTWSSADSSSKELPISLNAVNSFSTFSKTAIWALPPCSWCFLVIVAS